MKLLAKQKETHRLREPTYGYWVRGRDRLGIWDGHVHTGIFKVKDQQGPMYSTGNSAVRPQPEWVRSFRGEWIHVYIHHRVPSLFT